MWMCSQSKNWFDNPTDSTSKYYNIYIIYIYTYIQKFELLLAKHHSELQSRSTKDPSLAGPWRGQLNAWQAFAEMHGHRFLLVPWAIIGVDNVG